ncbi:hypothetical protein MRB53_041453 [Persea americana]|nr:hypothetical protein MRB53_041453 [Persea americana]
MDRVIEIKGICSGYWLLLGKKTRRTQTDEGMVDNTSNLGVLLPQLAATEDGRRSCLMPPASSLLRFDSWRPTARLTMPCSQQVGSSQCLSMAGHLSITGADKAANLARARSKVLEAASKGAKLVVLPECFNSPYGTSFFPKYHETLLPSPPSENQSPTFHALSKLAKEAKTYLVGGSIPEYWEETKKFYNTSLTFGPDGKLLATHRKVHLFDIDIPGKIKFQESEVLSPGNKVTLVDLPEYGKIAVAICYDVRFPELAMIAARRGAFLLVYPGAFNLTTGALHWELQARARAVDNQVYVGLCSPARDMEAEYHAWGHSMIVDPNAQILAQLDEKEDIVYADLNGDRIEEVRKGIPIYTQRRFDVYPDVSEGKVKYEE